MKRNWFSMATRSINNGFCLIGKGIWCLIAGLFNVFDSERK